MSETRFVHLHLHSQYSLVDSMVDVDDLVAEASRMGMPAVALTDQCNFFALVKFYKAALKAGLKPILGADFHLASGDGEEYPFTLLALNERGYRNITLIISQAYLEGQRQGKPYVSRKWLEEYNEGVLALSGAQYGDIGRALLQENMTLAEKRLRGWMELFPGRFYLELQRTGRPREEEYIQRALPLAVGAGCPVVATNDVRFLSAESYAEHELRVCIHDADIVNNPRRVSRYSAGQYLRSEAEMVALFADIPSALANSVAIARRCTVKLKLGKYHLPDYPLPPEYSGLGHEVFFRETAHNGLTERLAFLFDTQSPDFPEKEKTYRARLDFELDTILKMGFSGYFLIVMEFIQWAKDNGIPVGPGRGSGAGSLVAYSLKITDLDPLAYDLLFERFLNPERVSMPDFDIDFCMIRRDEVIEHVKERYGQLAVSQIITFGTMAAKAVVRDVARAMGIPVGLADRVAKMIPNHPEQMLRYALGQFRDDKEKEKHSALVSAELQERYENDEEIHDLIDKALKLEGVVRGVGKHAGGVVIAPGKLTDFAPLYCDEDGNNLVTQYDKGDVEEAGLVKFDFLGLRTLTIIDWACKSINRCRAASGEKPLDILAIPLDDRPTYELLKKGETTAVFQVESRGMKKLIREMSPDNFEDLVALLALFRPGPLDSGMVADFVSRKHGRSPVAYPDEKYQHPSLKPILEPTYGVIVYQEQVMQIAQVLAGYTLGGADLLRRAMGKKDAKEMEKQRESFRSGAERCGVDPDLAMKIFDLVEKFAGYGFNKSHSAAYAVVSFQTAWLKTHYPAEFMAAVLSAGMEDTDGIVVLIDECKRMGLPIVNPDVNAAEFLFTVDGEGRIVYGLGAIKGLGEGPVSSLVAARREGGPFRDLFDFCRRIDQQRFNKRALEVLVKAGAFDSLGEPRPVLFAAIDNAMRAAQQQNENLQAGMTDLFGEVAAVEVADPYQLFRRALWSEQERLAAEKSVLGLYLTGHPLDEYRKELEGYGWKKLSLLTAENAQQLVAGFVVDLREMRSKKGERILIVTMDDNSGRQEVTLYQKTLEEWDARGEKKISEGMMLFIRGIADIDNYSGLLRFKCESLMTLQGLRALGGRKIRITLEAAQWDLARQKQFRALFESHVTDGCGVVIRYTTAGARGDLCLGPEWRLEASEENMQKLYHCFGHERVTIG